MFKWVLALLLGLLPAQAAIADGMVGPRYRSYYPGYYLPPERHVVEVVQPPWSGNFIMRFRSPRFTRATS